MVTFSMLLFWIPVCIGVISFFYFTKRSRKAIILVLSFLPSAFFYNIICQIKRDKTFHLRNSKKLLMVFGNLVIF
ncbi:hypothetical protein [Enterococcus faecium]|uniref:hypothetical protein n=1 Tax=Enterococcus faecium TaxID=1352 RepID=UPI00115A5F72|nr:hypothetical protein [Enterococcus faecium]